MNQYKHLFFDMDQTVAPARQPILPEMYQLLNDLPQDIIIVSGQEVAKIAWQSNDLPSYTLGQNGNHATDIENRELWNIPLDDKHRAEIMQHIEAIIAILDHDLNHDWTPIEDRGSQITFSPIGNTAPIEHKRSYDPDRKKREWMMAQVPFESDELVVKIGGSTSLDYIHKDRHKGTNVQKLIDLMNWNKDECIYFGDGLYPGGNDEAVIGVIETVAVDDHLDTYRRLREMFG
ncbi:MAG: HAD-IIB family hydrolase [Candidatus Pacebacteria bacterium]|nr:HAD-IIB family hydrolase [Candidatus Paceibacterota bacterium]